MIIKGIPARRTDNFGSLIEYIRSVVEYVRIHGDRALVELTKKYDGVEIESIRLDSAELEKCIEGLPDAIRRSIDMLYTHLYNIHSTILPRDIRIDLNGVSMGISWRSIERIGIYVPSGYRSYPSTLLMAGIPAIVAGVREVYVSSPPMRNGCVNPAIAYGAVKIGAKEVYRVGGPHAIAAMAYGTESVVKVNKIVGPGSVYVQAAKHVVREVVDIDGIEGPTELAIIADEHADHRKIVLNMKSQAEHSKDTFIVLLTFSHKVIENVERELSSDVNHTYYLALVRDIDEAIDIVNNLAPEHLSLYVKNPFNYLDRIRNAGAITLGSEPSAMVDYLGPDHILPTSGWAKTRGVLTVYDFLKPIAIFYSSKDIASEILFAARILAEYEGFQLHSQSMGVDNDV